MGRILVANRRGHQVVEWDTVDTEEARQQVSRPSASCARRARAGASSPRRSATATSSTMARSTRRPRSTRSLLLLPAAKVAAWWRRLLGLDESPRSRTTRS